MGVKVRRGLHQLDEDQVGKLQITDLLSCYALRLKRLIIRI